MTSERCASARLVRHCAVVAMILTGLAANPGAVGQGHRKIIVNQENDEAPTIAVFDHPDYVALRQPDFVHRDLPLFQRKLILSEEQFAAVERLLEDYLAKFKALTIEHLPMRPEKGALLEIAGRKADFGAIEHEDDAGADGVGMWGVDVEALEELEELEEQGMSGGLGVRVMVEAPMGENGAGPAPADGDEGGASVSVQFESADGQEIPEEVRKRLEENAARMAQQIKAQVEQRIAEGGEARVGPAFENIEELQAYHDQMKAKAEAFKGHKARLRQTFVTDVQTTVLAEPQLERWPALERALRRSKTLPQGRLSGERTDLIAVLESLKLTEAEFAAVTQQCDEYELALDAALRLRNDYLADANTKMNQAMQAGDYDKALSIIDRGTDLRMAVRNTNAQHADLIATALGAHTGDLFRSAALRASYPRVFGPTFGQRTFEAVRKIDDLEGQTRSAIAELEKAYLAELDAMNQQLRQVIDRNQPLESRAPIEHLKSISDRPGDPAALVMINEDRSKPIAEAFERRRELDQRYAKLVRELLTPAQAEALPEAPSRKPMEPVIIEIPVAQ